jgi:shikimate dehydrogenase
MGIPYAEVIGDPIDHSKSPAIHRFWLDQLGLERDYRATRVTEDTLEDYLATRRADTAWLGCNVTMPLKRAAAEYLDEANEIVARLGATNCILPRRGGLYGTNHDSDAIFYSIASTPCSGRALVIGTGGAARAGLWALARLFPRLGVMSRHPESASEMADQLGITADILAFGGAPDCDFLVNATPLGMTGRPPLPIGLENMPSDGGVLDMVYDPLVTPLLADARRRGMNVFDGLSMLIEQAAMSFVSFFNAGISEAQRIDVRGAIAT